MSKGNIILGDSSGKLGDVVLYRAAGSQIARLRIRHPRNPRSTRQMVQRVFQATCTKGYSWLKDICDHSFEGKQGKRENFGEFIKLNRGKMNEILNDFASGWQNLKGYNLKGQLEMLYFPFIISNGTLPFVEVFGNAGLILLRAWRGTDYNFTYQNLVDALGAKKGDQLTILEFNSEATTGIINKIKKIRIILEPNNGNMDELFANSETTFVNKPNAKNEGNPKIQPSREGLGFNVDINAKGGAAILSRYEDGMWKRSYATLHIRVNPSSPSTLGDAVKSWWQTPAKGKYLNQAERQLSRN